MKNCIKCIKNYLIYKIRKTTNPKRITLSGIKIDMSIPILNKDIKKIIYNEKYEQTEIKILKQVLEDTDFVMEAGTGMGFLSTYIAKEIGEERIISYEANPNLIKHIKSLANLNGVDFKLKNKILSNNNGKTKFFIQDYFLSSSTNNKRESKNSVYIENIDINKEIDKYRPNFLLIDIEGAEKELIFDIRKWNVIDKLLIELHPHIISDAEITNIIRHLANQGFNLMIDKSENRVYFFEKSRGSK